MGFRFFKRIRIAPGVSINLSKSSPSISIGPRGLKYTLSRRGKRVTFGLPGTGLSYSTRSGWSGESKDGKKGYNLNIPHVRVPALKGLFASSGEKAFISGLKSFVDGEIDDAYRIFASTSAIVDAVFMHGFIALGKGQYSQADKDFQLCNSQSRVLGKVINQCTNDFKLSLAITDYIDALIDLDDRGLVLAHLEALQKLGKYPEALNLLAGIWNSNPGDIVVCLSLCDLVVASPSVSKDQLDEVIQITSKISNDEPIHTNILYLRGAAMFRIGDLAGAISQLSKILRRKSGRPAELMHQIKYLRGVSYDQLNQKQLALKDYKSIYFENPSFKDVANRLAST